MPRIPDDHLQSVVFIYPTSEDASEGTQVGGSGFVINYPSGVGNWRIRYVVTNEHVVDGGAHWVRLNQRDTVGTYTLNIPPEDWRRSPWGDDWAVSVLPLPQRLAPFELSLDSLGLTRDGVRELAVGPGDQAYMVGRFIAHGGRATNNPIARFGNIALMPNALEPIRDGRGKDVEAFLVEMRSHAGFSGSPVFLLIPQFSFRGTIGDTSLEDNETKFRLIGVDTGHKIDSLSVMWRSPGQDWTRRDDLRVNHYSDVSIVAPIWRLIEFLETKDLVDERTHLAEELEKRFAPLNGPPDSAADDSPGFLDVTEEGAS